MARMSDVIRQAMRLSGQSIYRISKDADLPYPVVHHFYHQRRGLTLDSAEKLADYFQLELVSRPTARRVVKKK